MGQALPPIPTQSTLPPPPSPSQKSQAKDPCPTWATYFGKWLPLPFHPKGKSPQPLASSHRGHYPPLPEGPLSSFPPLSILPLDQGPAWLLLPIPPVPNRQARSLGSHRRPLTLPSSKRKQTKQGCPPTRGSLHSHSLAGSGQSGWGWGLPWGPQTTLRK